MAQLQAGDLERSFTTEKPVADQVLREHTVKISTVLNLPSLMPYLIQYGCLTVDNMGQFPNTESQRSNNLKFIRMIQERGVFNSFMKALVHFTKEERGEEAHKELLDSLESGIKKFYSRRVSNTSQATTRSAPMSRSISETIHEGPTLVTQGEYSGDVVERDVPQAITEEGIQPPQVRCLAHYHLPNIINPPFQQTQGEVDSSPPEPNMVRY